MPCENEGGKFRKCMSANNWSRPELCDSLKTVWVGCLQKWRVSQGKPPLDVDYSSVRPPPQCKHLTCPIQTCLKFNNNDTEKCQKEISEYKQCAAKYGSSE
eukprot:TRINITY_DN112386_c0_g1_i1.p1 TRINITY_DN112386_c0_g1~~TRINITY_DN112386_c0_g1_i1.p1  ORF type:complete len:101 (-),score=1.79 TRINITY_DN112386_c0_g1_i1:408-710(-)